MRGTPRGPWRLLLLWTLSLCFAFEAGTAADEGTAGGRGGGGSTDRPNGFALAKLQVAREEILQGGPPRDGIPRVDNPQFAAAAEASWVSPGNPVIGVEIRGEARAYPVHLIEYHQVVNDEIAGVPVAVTYDPLSGSPVVFHRKVGERVLRFGISGLVYQCNFVLYDLDTESLWSQLRGVAIAGTLAGAELGRVQARQEPLGAWLLRYPDSKVLVRPLPRRIDYRYSPFSAYWISETVPFPVASRDTRFHPKEVVLAVEVEGAERAYLGSILTASGGRIVDEFRGRKIHIAYDGESGTFAWQAPADVRVSDAYWFAWKAFHPDTEIWQSEASSPD